MVESETTPEGNNWRVESFRMTTFHQSTDEPAEDVAALWESVAGGKPEQVSLRSQEDLTLVEGLYGGNRLVFTRRPDRIDWNLQCAPRPPNVPAVGFITMGPLPDLVPLFLEISRKWLIISSGITRLAFGSVLLAATDDLPAANEKLNSLLPKVELDPTGSFDFFYQINRRRQSNSNGQVVINRLSRWTITQGGSFEVDVQGNTEPQFKAHFACRLELDINTAGALGSVVAGEAAVQSFEELVQLGREIAEKGDIS